MPAPTAGVNENITTKCVMSLRSPTEDENASRPNVPIGGQSQIPAGFPLKACGNDGRGGTIVPSPDPKFSKEDTKSTKFTRKVISKSFVSFVSFVVSKTIIYNHRPGTI